jgi:hypothetical protein
MDGRRLASFERVQPREAPTDSRDELFPDSPVEFIQSSGELQTTRSDGEAHIPACPRIARLLRTLRELDESLAGLEQMPKAELSSLIYSVLRESGFVDPSEARHAIAGVLEVIERQAPVMESSCW